MRSFANTSTASDPDSNLNFNHDELLNIESGRSEEHDPGNSNNNSNNSNNNNDNVDPITCRICLDYAKRDEVISPCNCKGSSTWIHRECLDNWRATSDTAFKTCSVCLANYKLRRVISRAELYDKCSYRFWKFRFLVIRDFLIGSIALQAVIIGLGFLVYACDSRKHLLLTLFGAGGITNEFYYLCGMFCFSFIVGFCFLLTLFCSDSGDSRQHYNTYTDTYCFIYLPVNNTGGGGGGDGGCCSCCSCCADCRGCHDLIVCGGECLKSSTESCKNCSNGNCDGGGDPTVMVCLGSVLLACICIIAATGFVISVVCGFMFVTSTLERHVGILYRRQMVSALVVQDLQDSKYTPDSYLGSTPNPLNEEEVVDDVRILYIDRENEQVNDIKSYTSVYDGKTNI